jgi:hypothetical protein
VAIWVLFAVIGGAIAVFLAVYQQLERKRRDALAACARELGMEINWQLPPEDREPFQRFGLAKKATRRSSNTTMVADTGETRLLIFEHVVITSNGESQHRSYYVIGMARDPRLAAPPLSMQPRTWQTAVAGFFGYQDVDFPTDPDFGAKFCVRGSSAEGIQAFLNARFREHVKSQPKLHIEASGDALIVIQSRTRLQAGNLKSSLDSTYRVLKLLLPE